MQGYLPLTGGTLTGTVRFGTTASIDELVDFGLVAKMDSGNLGIVTQSIIHTNDSTSTDGVTYTLANIDSDIHYTCAGNGVKQMNIGSFETVKVSSSLLVAEDPTQNMQVATKQYVDQHASGGEQTYYDASSQMVFKIKLLHETTGLYTCDCYYIANSTKHINISSGKMSGFMEVPHTLSTFLTDNGFTFEGSNINFVSFASHSSGFCSNQLCSLGEEYLTLWCTSPTPVSARIEIPFNLNNGFLCSAILRK